MRLFGRSKRPKEVALSDDSVQLIMEFVHHGWIPIAAAGWQGYDGAGPGFLFMDFEEDETKYVPASNPHISNPRDPYFADARKKMKKYNPKTEVVVVFHQFVPGNTTSMLLPTPKGMPKPPEAFRMVQENPSLNADWE
jgi:hypothetical protein